MGAAVAPIAGASAAGPAAPRWPLRLLGNALFYVLRTGCAWRYLPREYPPWQTVDSTFSQWCLHGSCPWAVRVIPMNLFRTGCVV